MLNAPADFLGKLVGAAGTFIKDSTALEQTVTITAEFPNATNHSEIEQAFENIVNMAAQYAQRN